MDSLTYVVGNIYFYSVSTCGGNFRFATRLTSGNVSMHNIQYEFFSRCVHAKQNVLKRMSLTEIKKIIGYGVDDRGPIRNGGMHDNTGSWTHSTNQKLGLLP